MNSRQCFARLLAYKAGRPLPSGETLHFHIAKNADLLILAFVKMGGESGPWAVGFKTPGKKATVLTTPEPRRRQSAAQMIEKLAPILLTHLRHPEHDDTRIEDADHGLPVRQIWLPNSGHIEMLHQLAYTYTFTKQGEPEEVAVRNAVGRACNWLFSESERPGQMTVMAANAALHDSYIFPCETVRQAHLGYLLAWLGTQGGIEARLAAASAAEASPIAPSLDPELEREQLQPWLEDWNKADAAGDTKAAEAHAARIAKLLTSEVERRLALVEDAITLLRADERRMNPGVNELCTASLSAHWYNYLSGEYRRLEGGGKPVFTPSPETDRNPGAAAAAYTRQEEAAELYERALLPHDAELRAQAVADGSAIRGTITAIEDLTEGRRKLIYWTVEAAGLVPLKFREGSELCIADYESRHLAIESIRPLPNGRRSIRFRVTAGFQEKRLPGRRHILVPENPALMGTSVFLVDKPSPRLGHLKRTHASEKGTPGSWLTHMKPSGVRADLPAEITGQGDASVSEEQS